MGCMNGRCSDGTTDVDSDQLINPSPRQQGINSSINSSEYTVRHLPPSPRPLDGKSPEDDYQDGFQRSVGGTMRWELHQDHMITSTSSQPESSSSRNGTNQHGRYDDHQQLTQSATHQRPNGLTTPPTSSSPQPPVTVSDIRTARGREIFHNLKKSYEWKDQFEQPSQDFLSLMDRLYMECQLHLTALSSRGSLEHRREADMIVQEMITVRNHWGPGLLPNSICNAFVRERIPMTLGANARQFRIDCAQFFEPVPFYGTQQAGNPGELMKLFRFSVYDLMRNEVVLRYYLERSNVTQLYHVLCFTCESYRGQVHPYGSEQPSYWDIRHKMLEDVCSRLLSALSPGDHNPPPQPHVATIFPPSQGKGSVIIQVPTSQRNN